MLTTKLMPIIANVNITKPKFCKKITNNCLFCKVTNIMLRCLLHRDEYIDKSLQLLVDVNSYKLLNRNPITTYQLKTNKLVSNLKNTQAFHHS